MIWLFAQDGPVIPDFERGVECVRENRKFCWDWFSTTGAAASSRD